MSRKLVILFAVLAIAYVASGDASTGSPSSAYTVAVGNVFTNATDTAFTNIQPVCYFTAGFDNTTNYVWCNAGSKSQDVEGAENVASAWAAVTGTTGTDEPSDDLEVLTLQRRAINASSPSTVNSTLDTKITTSITANDGGVICPGVAYLGIAYSYGSGSTAAELQSDVYLAYIAVNGTSATSVKLTSVGDTIRAKVQACLFDNNIFYVVYTTDSASQDEDQYDNNAVYIQGVNVTSGAAYYNSTGGVKILSPATDEAIPYGDYKLIPTNWTGYGSSMAMLLFSDSSSSEIGTAITDVTDDQSSESTGSTWKILPITLSTGAPGSVISAGVSGSSTTAFEGTDNTFTTTTTATTYALVGGFGSLSTYGVALTKEVSVIVDKKTDATTHVTDYPADAELTYTSYMFLNGSSTVSTTFNMTNPTGYHLTGLGGYSTDGEEDEGFALVSFYDPDDSDGTSYQVNLDTYYSNGTAIVSATSLGTFDTGADSGSTTPVSVWQDAVGSPWLGYILYDGAADWTGLGLLSGYAGEIAYNPLSANALSSIFAALALMIAALFAF